MIVKSDIISILCSAFKQPPTLRLGDTQLLFECPICNRNDGIKKLEICIEGAKIGYSHCWRCSLASRSFGGLLRKINAPQYLRDKLFNLSGEIKKYKKGEFPKKTDNIQLELPTEFRPLYKSYNSPEYKNAIYYLKTRNVFIDDIIRYNIGYCEDGSYQNHIIIPSYDKDNKLNFFIGRKYYNVDGDIPHKKPNVPMGNIIGFENLINWNYKYINLVEGCFDAFSVRNNAIPLFGKYVLQKLQLKLIEYKIKRVNIILDNDALQDAVKNCQTLMKNGVNVHLVRLNGKDPSKIGFKAVHDLIKNSFPFNWEQLTMYKLNNV